MNIDTIENGYVIDHITSGKAIILYNLLELDKLDCEVALITNAKSKKSKTKDIIKIGKLIDINLDKIAFIDDKVTINTIKDNQIIEKKKLTLPKRLVNVSKCKNPRCITSIETHLDQVFILDSNNKYRCQYCETILEKDN